MTIFTSQSTSKTNVIMLSSFSGSVPSQLLMTKCGYPDAINYGKYRFFIQSVNVNSFKFLYAMINEL